MKKLVTKINTLLVAAALSLLSANAIAGEKKDIINTAVAEGSFNTLMFVLSEAGLIETLKGEGPFTIFAPTDEAFAKIPVDQLKVVIANKDALTAILTYHVVSGEVLAADLVKLKSVKTVQGSDVSIISIDGNLIVDKAAIVVKTDIMASNGVIHVIDAVIAPE